MFKSEIKRSFILFWRLMKIGLKRETEFRTNFLISILQFLIYNALFLTFWQALMGNIHSLKTWSLGELLVFTFTGSLYTGLNIFFLGLHRLPEAVRNGDLDKYLCRPVNPVIVLSLESVPMTEFLRWLLVNIICIAICVYRYNLQVIPMNILLAALLLILGTLVFVLISGSISLLSFWFGKVETFNYLLDFGHQFDKYPINIFPNIISTIFTWIIPVGFIITYPAMILLNKPLPVLTVFLIGISLLILWGIFFFWLLQKALTRYEAFGG